MRREFNPVFGIYSIPFLGPAITDDLEMRPREILAANLKALMAASASLSTFPDIIKASNGRITNGTLDRIRREESAAGVDTLEPIATVFGLEPWHLLVPGLQIRPGRDGDPVIDGLPAWPLEMVDKGRYTSLPAPDKAYAQAKMMAAIEERESAASATNDRRLTEQALLKPKTPPSRRGARAA